MTSNDQQPMSNFTIINTRPVSVWDSQDGKIITGLITSINMCHFELETPDGQVYKFALNMLPPTVVDDLRPRYVVGYGGRGSGKTLLLKQWFKNTFGL